VAEGNPCRDENKISFDLFFIERVVKIRIPVDGEGSQGSRSDANAKILITKSGEN
jgi:hypothetical protein